MILSSFYLMRVKIQLSSVFKCASCVGIWTSSTKTTYILPVLITSLALAPTCAMIHCSLTTLRALRQSNGNTLLHLRCLSSHKTCLIIEDQAFPNNFPKPYLLSRLLVSRSSPALSTWQIGLSHLFSHLPSQIQAFPFGNSTIPTYQPLLASFPTSTGQYKK